MSQYFQLPILGLSWLKQSLWRQHDSAPQETILGVYHAVDPAIYSVVYPASPNEKIKEVADLMAELYQTFIDMRYINQEDVSFAPHVSPAIDVSKAAEYGLTKDVVDLMQMVPYRIRGPNWNHGSDNGEFILWGEFMDDMRGPDANWWTNVVDPFYAIDNLDPDSTYSGKPEDANTRGWDHEEGPYMRPWYATMTNCGNHGSVMILDTKSYHIWLIDQLGGSNDPALRNSDYNRKTTNRMDLNQYPSRPGHEFLRDMISRFRSLEWIPGGLYNSQHKMYDMYKEAYITAGWPDQFDGALFDRLRQDAEDAESRLYASYEPIKALDQIAGTLEWQETVRERFKDVTSRLEAQDFASEDEHQGLIRQQEELAKNQKDSWWSNYQAQLQKNLEHEKAELALLLSRKGRFSDMTDEDLNKAIADEWFVSNIRSIEVSIADENEDARNSRMLQEAKVKAAEVTEKTWIAFEENGPHLTTLTTKQLQRVLREDLKLEDIRKMVNDNRKSENISHL